MKRLIVISITVLVLFLVSCNLFDPESNEIPKWYPSTWTYSNWEMIEFNSKYNRFINTFDLSDIKVGIDSLSAHMHYIQIDDNFLLCDFTNTTDSVEEFRSKIFEFYHDWWRLFSYKRFVIDSSRISISDGGSVGGTFYIKNTYDQLLKDPKRELGSLRASVDNNGRLFYLRSSLVPHLRIPDHPLISETDAIDILEGYEYTINAWLYSNTVTLSREDLDKSELTVYVQETVQDSNECLKYWLAWRFECREVDVYVDAMTGEIIGHEVTVLFI